MKKNINGIYVYQIIIVLLLGIIGIILGSFYDFNISKNIVNTSSPMGGFVETLGESLGYMMIPIGGTSLFIGLYKRKNVWLKVLGYFLLLISIGIGIYFLGDSFIASNDSYGITFNVPISYVISSLTIIITSIVTYFLLDNKEQDKLIKAGIIILVSMLLQFLILNLLKSIGGRPRYRFLIDESRNINNETYKNWYEFSPFKFKNDFHKSWPSGHTATACVTMLLATLSPCLRFKFKYSEKVLFYIGFAYTLFIAFFRIYYGAHYLSDVSFGLIISSLICFLISFAFRNLFMKKENTNTENSN